MIRKIILYNEGIETLIFFSKQLGAAFERMGYETFYLNQDTEYDSFLKLLEFIEPGVTASVGFNFNGCSGEDYLYDKIGVHLYDFRGVKMVNIVVDHPFYYHKFVPYLPENYIQLSIDGEHEDYLKRFFPEIRRGPECPLAGTSVIQPGNTCSVDRNTIKCAEESGKELTAAQTQIYENKHLSWNTNRLIPIVFTGNYNPPEKQDPVLARNGPEYEAFYHDLIDDFIAHPDYELTATIERHLRENFSDELTEEKEIETEHSDGYRFSENISFPETVLDQAFAKQKACPSEARISGWNSLFHSESHTSVKKVDGRVIKNNTSVKKVSEKTIENKKTVDEKLKEVFPYMIVIDLYIRHYFRGEVVRTLVDAGIPIHVYGAGWEQLRVKRPDCLITHPNIKSLECLQRIAESDISLNVMPWFKRGAHDRVFNSMLNGAVCLTDPSDFLLKEFIDGEDIVFYKLDELDKLPDIVTTLQNDRERMELIRGNAYKKCINRHTWAHRAEMIVREFLN